MSLFRAHQAKIDKESKGSGAPHTPGGKGAKKRPYNDSTPATSKEVCRKYLAGTCTRGKKCRYLHPKGKEGSNAEAESPSDELEDTPAAPVPRKKGKKQK